MGFPGGNKQGLRWLAERRTVPAKVGRRRNQSTDDIRTAVAALPWDGELPSVSVFSVTLSSVPTCVTAFDLVAKVGNAGPSSASRAIAARRPFMDRRTVRR